MPYRKRVPWQWSKHGQHIPAHYVYPWWDATCRWFHKHESMIFLVLTGILSVAWIFWLSAQSHTGT